jgi:CheY-like chemotaxis protein
MFGEPMRALVADDHEGHQRLLCAILSSLGLEVEVAKDGAAAVAAAKATPFDLILMDVSMPVLDGLEATRQIREHEKATGARANIVVVTSHSEPADFALSRAAGADGHVTKPLSVAGLLGNIEGHYLAVA